MYPRNVVVLADDPGLLEAAATELSREGFRVSTSRSALHRADLVLRDWRDDRRIRGADAPVVSLDLSVIRGRELVRIATRVLGQPVAPLTTFAALAILLRGRLPKA